MNSFATASPTALRLPGIPRLQLTFVTWALLVSFLQYWDPSPIDFLFGAAILCLPFTNLGFNKTETRYLIFAYIFMVANLVAAFFWKVPSFGLFNLVTITYLLAVPLLFSQLARAYGSRCVDFLYGCLLVAVSISALLGVTAATGFAVLPSEYVFIHAMRVSPLFQDPNVFAPYLYFGMFVAIGVAFHSQKRFFVLISIVFVAALAIVLAFSRAAWAASAAAALIFLIGFVIAERRGTSWRRLSTISVCMVPVALVGAIWFLQSFDLWEFLEMRFRLQSYDTDRFSNQANALRIAIENPLGIGPGHYVGRADLPEGDFDISTHNLYLKILVERGFAGLLSYLCLLGACAFALISSMRQSDRYLIRLGLLATLVGVVLNSLVIDSLHWRHLYILIGFIMAEVVISKQSDSTYSDVPSARSN